MDDKKLHRLNKTELLWIIRDQEAELEELREYVKRLGGNPDKKADDSTEQPQPERRGQTDKSKPRTGIQTTAETRTTVETKMEAGTKRAEQPRHTDKGGVS